jgi:hypothetical protein
MQLALFCLSTLSKDLVSLDEGHSPRRQQQPPDEHRDR